MRVVKYGALALFALVISVLPLWGQSAKKPGKDCKETLSGQVLDLQTKQPLPYASVSIKGTSRGTTTNEQGFFSIPNLCLQEYDLVFSFIGYKTLEHHHDMYHELPVILLAPDSLSLESVIIEGQAIKGSLQSNTLSSVGAQELERVGGQSLGAMLNSIAGVSSLQTGQNISKPIVHGLHSNRVLIINNEIRHEYQSWGREHAPEVDPGLAESLTLIKGAATVRYGPDALGGVILVQPPAPPLNSPLSGRASMQLQSNGRSAQGGMRISQGGKRWAASAEGRYIRQGDLQAPGYVLSNTGKQEYSAAAGVLYHGSQVDVSLYASHFNQNLGILRGSITGNLIDLSTALARPQPFPTFDFTYEINTPRQETEHNLAKAKVKWYDQNQTLELTYAFQQNLRKEFDVRRGALNERPAINLDLITHTLDLTWQHAPLGQWQGTVGFQGMYQDNNNIFGTNTIPFIPNYNNSRAGLFIIESRELSERTIFEVGSRFDYQYTSARGRDSNNDVFRNTLDFQNITGTLGLVHTLPNGHVWRTNLGTAWRPPNVSELYSFGKHQATVEYGLWRYEIGPEGITADRVLTEAEREVPSEQGYKLISTYSVAQESKTFEFTTFANYIANFIFSRPAGITQTVRGAFPYFIYDQTNALLVGADATLFWQLSPRWQGTLTASYLWARNLEEQDVFVGMPPANLGYEVRWQMPDKKGWPSLQAQAQVQYTFEQFQAPRVVSPESIQEAQAQGNDLFAQDDSIFDFVEVPNGYLLVNAGLFADWTDWSASLQVQNLLNTSYRAYTDRMRYFTNAVGVNLQMGLQYNF